MTFKRKSPIASGACRNNIRPHHSINSSHTKQRLSYAEVNAMALPVLFDILRRWLPDGVLRGSEYQARNPNRNDQKIGSFSINIRTGQWADFSTGDKGGDIISLAAYLFAIRQSEAKKSIAEMMGI
jgi:hypothetical protein